MTIARPFAEFLAGTFDAGAKLPDAEAARVDAVTSDAAARPSTEL